MATKFQTQLLINPVTRDRADALAIALGEPRAEILRQAIEGRGLTALEKAHAERLEPLRVIARLLGMTRTELARQMTEQKLSLTDWDPVGGRFRD